MIAAQFEHIYKDNNKSDDLTGDVNNDKSSASDSENEELQTGTGKKNVPNISYSAEFYEYIGPTQWASKLAPALRKTVMNHAPFAITRANATRNEAHSMDVTSIYAIQKGVDTAHDHTLLSAGILAELGIYTTIRSKILKESLENISPYYPTIQYDREELVLHE